MKAAVKLKPSSWLLGPQDSYYAGTIKGVGRIYQQTIFDTYTK